MVARHSGHLIAALAGSSVAIGLLRQRHQIAKLWRWMEALPWRAAHYTLSADRAGGGGAAHLQTFGGSASRKHRGRTPERVAAVTSARVVEFGRFGESWAAS